MVRSSGQLGRPHRLLETARSMQFSNTFPSQYSSYSISQFPQNLPCVYLRKFLPKLSVYCALREHPHTKRLPTSVGVQRPAVSFTVAFAMDDFSYSLPADATIHLDIKMATRTSARSQATAEFLSTPWKFAARQDYDKETNPNGLISFALAENKLAVQDVRDFVNSNVKFEDGDFNYGSNDRFPKALATHLTEYLRPFLPIKPEYIRSTSSCTGLHDILSWAIADPDEAILLNRPIYGRFELDFTNRSRVKIIYADTDAETCTQESAVQKYEDAIADAAASGISVRAILIVNPNNPLGQCYHRNTLVGLMKLCQRHQIHLISDEVYACSVFESEEPEAVPFTSILSIDPRDLIDLDLLHIEYGFAKDFASGGMKLGALVSQSGPILKAVDSLMRFHGASGPVLNMACAMLEDRAWCRAYIGRMRGKIATAHKHVTEQLRSAGIRYLPGSNAGFFVWVDLSDHLPQDFDGEENTEFALAKKLLHAGVFLHPREEHGNKPGWFRLVYTQEPEIITEGIKRIRNSIA